MAESKEELKRLLMKAKEESEKNSIQKTKIMATSPITSWQYRWGNSGNSDRLYFLGLQIIADGDTDMKLKVACSLEEKL